MSRMGCSHHCRTCNACFSSLKAFDAHRVFAEGHPGDWDHRVCIEPLDDRRFELKTGDGVCNLARPQKTTCRIWMLAGGRDHYQRNLGKRLTGSGPKSDLDLGEAA